MAKGRKRASVKDIIEKEVADVDLDAVSDTEEYQDVEESDQDLAVAQFNASSGDQVDAKDIFVEAFEKARLKNTTPRFRIYKNGALTGSEEGKYDFEKLRKKYGHGDFKIVAVDRNHQFLGSQVIELGPLPGWEAEEAQAQAKPVAPPQPGVLELVDLIRNSVREAKEEALNSKGSESSAMVTMMTTLMTVQSESSKQMAMMINEQNKIRADQEQRERERQEKADERERDRQEKAEIREREYREKAEARQMEFFKLQMSERNSKDTITQKDLRDAEQLGEKRAKDMFAIIEAKVDKLADERAELIAGAKDDGGEEKGLTGILKGVLPIIGDMVKNAPAQHAAQQREVEAVQAAQVPAPGTQTPEQNAQMRAAHFKRVSEERRAREIIERGRQGVPQNFAPATTQQQRPTQNAPSKGPVLDVTANPTTKVGPIIIKTKQTEGNGASMEPVREKIFNIVRDDIGAALLTRKDSGETAAECLKTLESQGIDRQTVLEVFSFADMLRYAKNAGIPAMAKPWLQGFYDWFEKNNPSSAAAVASNDGDRTRTQSIEST